MKTLYLIRHAKSDWSDGKLADFERSLSKKGYQDLKIMSSYLSLINIVPDIILSSCALYSQETADEIARNVTYTDKIYYMKELYKNNINELLSILKLQDDNDEIIFMILHNSEITELVNLLVKENIKKVPTTGIVAIDLNIEQWEDITNKRGKLDFFIYPKQFKYYLPKQIRTKIITKKKS